MGAVVTLVVTDIVGSTRSWALYQAAMAADLAIAVLVAARDPSA